MQIGVHRIITIKKALGVDMLPVPAQPFGRCATDQAVILIIVIIRVKADRIFGIYIQQGTVVFIIQVPVCLLVERWKVSIVPADGLMSYNIMQFSFKAIPQQVLCAIIIASRLCQRTKRRKDYKSKCTNTLIHMYDH
ncbi:hypothetical protein D3C72_855520 [compost metagenome]